MANITVRDSSRTHIDVDSKSDALFNIGMCEAKRASADKLVFKGVIKPKAFVVFPVQFIQASNYYYNPDRRAQYVPAFMVLTEDGEFTYKTLYATSSQYASATLSSTSSSAAKYSYNDETQELTITASKYFYSSPGSFKSGITYKLIYFY